jgi:DNA-binding HxlR family transcriptional regulator
MTDGPRDRTLCPIGGALERIGDQWSILILREARWGVTRFDDFRRNLGIAPNILTRRLTGLVDAGIFARHRYSVKPPRDEYRLMPAGLDFGIVLDAFHLWGHRNLPIAVGSSGDFHEASAAAEASR